MMTFTGSEFWLKQEIYLKNSSYIIITNAETNQNWSLSDELITFTKWIHLDLIQHWIKRRKRSKDIDTSCTKLVSSFLFLFSIMFLDPLLLIAMLIQPSFVCIRLQCIFHEEIAFSWQSFSHWSASFILSSLIVMLLWRFTISNAFRQRQSL